MVTPVANKENLMHLLRTNSVAIRSFGVSKLGLFGSFARDTGIDSNSDVDFLVEFESGRKSFDNFIELGIYLEGLLARKVELVTPQSLSKYIGPQILKQVQHVEF